MSKQMTEPSSSEGVEREVSRDVKMVFDAIFVPNFVRIKSIGPIDKVQDIARIPAAMIEDVPHDVLDELVEIWLKDVYAKQGRELPFFHKSTIEWAKKDG